MRLRLARVCALVAAGLVTGCAERPTQQEALAQLAAMPFDPVYRGVDTRLLDGDLVNFLVEMEGARAPVDVEAYAECAAAQYTLIRGYGFARHVRTAVSEEGGLWRGDAVYTISPELPAGVRKIDAEVVAAACAENGIPMV